MKTITMDYETYRKELSDALQKGIEGGLNEAANIIHRVRPDEFVIDAFDRDPALEMTIGQGRLLEAIRRLTGREN